MVEAITKMDTATVEEPFCRECAFHHLPEFPHNAESLIYQLNFMEENDRPPSWDDAMAHCDDKIKKLWTVAVEDEGYPDTSAPMQGFFRKKGKQVMEPSERLQGQDAMYADKRPNAKRVSLDHVVSCIAHKTFFRASETGPDENGPLTICLLTMRNGFFIVGKGATIDPDVEFDASLGEQAAYDNALTQVFEKEAYVAMEQAWRQRNREGATAPADKITEAFPGSETIASEEMDDEAG